MRDLGARLLALVADGKAAWPEVAVAPERLVGFVAARLDHEVDPADLLGGLLSHRSAPGVRAHRRRSDGDGGPIDRHYMREVDIALARMRIGPPRSSDVKQLARQRLFVGDGVPASKIADYAGRGDLRRWVRSVAVRTCLNDLRKRKHEVLADDDQLIAQQAMPGDDL
ncbi:MAG: hypothetical protein HS111_17935 [Kofleriaceae bacterium]|nr:hypothetical protein [Kofleriaceae bacterium]